MNRRAERLLLLSALIISFTCISANAGNPLNLLPTPKVLKVEDGKIPLTVQSRIVVADPKLKPLADILSNEILLVTKLSLAVVGGDPKAGDIVLRINPKLQADAEILTVHGQEVLKTREYAHTIAVSDRIVIEGWDYRAVCEGTATLLQSILVDGDNVAVHRMTVKDWPYADYTSIMVDCARQSQPVYVLKAAVETCRLFKIRYLHLHLSDDNAYTFPSTAYPEANTKGGLKPYNLDELKDLVAYADVRGVTCVPEIEGPGHCTSLLDGMGGKLGNVSNRTMDVLNPDIYPVLDKLVGEMCEVFKSSPYFHIGGDEVEPVWYLANAHVKKYMKEHNLTGEHTIWLPYGQNMAKIVKKYGKKTVMWEGRPVGCPLDRSLENEIIVYTWFPGGQARSAQNDGFTTITVPWDLPPLPQFSLFTCNGTVLTPKDKVLGHCRPMWEMDCVALALQYLRGTPERDERTWGPDNVIEADYITNRMAKQNARADMIVRPVKITVEGKVVGPPGGPNDIFYDGPLTITLSSAIDGGRIRYTLDGTEPKANSPLYSKPLHLSESVMVRAALFDESGAAMGNVSLSPRCYYVDRQQNLTTGKKVTTSAGNQENDKPENAVDGQVRIDKYWGCGTTPSWLQVDLEKVYTLDRVHIFPYWDGLRYYQYTIELSTDGTKWTTVVDASKNTQSETEKGRLYTFKSTPARYVRVNMFKNSDNYAVHLVELRVFEAKP